MKRRFARGSLEKLIKILHRVKVDGAGDQR